MENKQRGYFGIGIYNCVKDVNIGTLWRSSHIFGSSFIYTIGNKYEKQSSDTMKSWRHIPLFHYETFEEFYENVPYSCKIIGIEISDKSTPIVNFIHPQRCVYLLGSENSGLSEKIINRCHEIVQLPGEYCLNVAVAGSLVMYDRYQKRNI